MRMWSGEASNDILYLQISTESLHLQSYCPFQFQKVIATSAMTILSLFYGLLEVAASSVGYTPRLSRHVAQVARP